MKREEKTQKAGIEVAALDVRNSLIEELWSNRLKWDAIKANLSDKRDINLRDLICDVFRDCEAMIIGRIVRHEIETGLHLMCFQTTQSKASPLMRLRDSRKQPDLS